MIPAGLSEACPLSQVAPEPLGLGEEVEEVEVVPYQDAPPLLRGSPPEQLVQKEAVPYQGAPPLLPGSLPVAPNPALPLPQHKDGHKALPLEQPPEQSVLPSVILAGSAWAVAHHSFAVTAVSHCP